MRLFKKPYLHWQEPEDFYFAEKYEFRPHNPKTSTFVRYALPFLLGFGLAITIDVISSLNSGDSKQLLRNLPLVCQTGLGLSILFYFSFWAEKLNTSFISIYENYFCRRRGQSSESWKFEDVSAFAILDLTVETHSFRTLAFSLNNGEVWHIGLPADVSASAVRKLFLEHDIPEKAPD